MGDTVVNQEALRNTQCPETVLGLACVRARRRGFEDSRDQRRQDESQTKAQRLGQLREYVGHRPDSRLTCNSFRRPAHLDGQIEPKEHDHVQDEVNHNRDRAVLSKDSSKSSHLRR